MHCLHAERLAARDRRQRIIVRLIAWTLSIAVVAIVGAAGVNAATRHAPPSTPPLRAATRHQSTNPPAAAQDSATLAVATTTIELQGSPAAAPAAGSDSTPHPIATAPTAATPPAVPHVDSTPVHSPIGPIIPQGRTDLPDSMYAVRRGDMVVVNFDTGPARTRRADKFELVVRQTLRAVYGAVADTLLAAVPDGKLVSASELVTTLPTRGIHLQGVRGPHVVVYPETKPGRIGPLVFAYRTEVLR